MNIKLENKIRPNKRKLNMCGMEKSMETYKRDTNTSQKLKNTTFKEHVFYVLKNNTSTMVTSTVQSFDHSVV